jgi:tRNA (mo5U34)-methyltransferase
VQLLDREQLYAELQRRGMAEWSEQLRGVCQQRFASESHGNLPKWMAAWHALPERAGSRLDATGEAVVVEGNGAVDQAALQGSLMLFHPWRKGPFELFGVKVDTEWRSNLKWRRIADKIDFRGKSILDVGCGNGYYGWKMLAAGADFVLGCDPFLLYILQFEVLRRYAPQPERHFVVPVADDELPPNLQAFDLTFSMGVLYHRPNPIDHLQTLRQTLRPGGQLVLETLVVEGDKSTVLVPENRYAKMRNVWFIPSLAMMGTWLKRTGYQEIELLDVAVTSVDEQRRTEWMTFESLADFLDSQDTSRTIEGYPAPRRAILTARKALT